jgi:tripartite-type tricarboxylate transporter receptor subunit TctC
MRFTTGVRRFGWTLLCFALGASSVAAQEVYPARTVRYIAPFPAGGTSDVLSRIIAQKLTEYLGRQVIVENRPGAGSNIGHEVVAKAPPDGYTLLMSSNTALAANPYLYKRLPFDPLNDFSPISLVGRSGPVLVVHPTVPAHNLKELVTLAKAQPGKLNFGSGGRGTPAHMGGEILKASAGINIVHVPYKGGILAVTDLVAGQIDMVFADMVPATPQIKAGKLRPLAVATENRSPLLPDVPTVAEAGMKERIPETWWAMVGPKGVPPAITQRLNSEIARIMREPDVRERYAGLGVFTIHTTPERVLELVRAEQPQIAKILKAAGVEPE